MSELKCCKICGAFLTCTRKGECCPECEYFDESDVICLAPDALKKKIKKDSPAVVEDLEREDDDVDPETFLFEDDDEEDDLISDSDEDDSFDDDDEEFELEEVEW